MLSSLSTWLFLKYFTLGPCQVFLLSVDVEALSPCGTEALQGSSAVCFPLRARALVHSSAVSLNDTFIPRCGCLIYLIFLGL